MAGSEWYYTVNGQQAPCAVSDADLKRMASAGQLSPGDLIWKEGMPSWCPPAASRACSPAPPPPAAWWWRAAAASAEVPAFPAVEPAGAVVAAMPGKKER